MKSRAAIVCYVLASVFFVLGGGVFSVMLRAHEPRRVTQEQVEKVRLKIEEGDTRLEGTSPTRDDLYRARLIAGVENIPLAIADVYNLLCLLITVAATVAIACTILTIGFLAGGNHEIKALLHEIKNALP